MQPFGVKILPRKRVSQHLEHLLCYPLTVLRAPVGMGKTTAMREFVREQALEPIWLSLLGSSGDLDYAWERLTALVCKRDSTLGQRMRKLGFPMDAPQLGRMVSLLCERTYSRPTVVVIDDYHLVDCPQMASLITLMAAEEVPNFHIVLIARSLSDLQIADLERRGLCLTIGQEVLEFLPQEIQDYAALMDCAADESTLIRLGKLTGGWISGLYLLLRGLRRGVSPQGERWRDADQLLEDNLYNSYDADTQRFLEQLSFLSAFTPEQVSFAFDSPAAGDRMVALSQGNAFLTWHDSLHSYKMTDLLREFLQEKGHAHGVDPKPMWRRIGQWFLSHGKIVPAYEYLMNAGEIETVLAHMDRPDCPRLRSNQYAELHRLFSAAPVDTPFRYPLATLRYLRLRSLCAPPSVREELTTQLEEMEWYFTTADLPDERRSRILGEIHNTWIFPAFPDVYATVDHARQAVAHFAGRYSCIVSSDSEFTYGAPHLLYCYYTKPGKLHELARFISTHFHILALAVEGCGAGSEALVLAEYALETGDFDSADRMAQKAIYHARAAKQLSIKICATFVLARLDIFRGHFAHGAQLIADLYAETDAVNHSVLNTTVELCAAYISSCFGKLDAIPAWMRYGDLETGSYFFQGVAFPYIISMRSALLAGENVRLELLCQEAESKFALYGNQLGFLHNYIYSAVAKQRLYGDREGCIALERAVALAEPDGLVMPFAENAISMLPMLRKLRTASKSPSPFLNKVISCCESYRKVVESLLPHSVTLSLREREILSMLAVGKKHAEISEKLFVSVATVRYHIQNVYQKLEVNNKVSAIEKAKSMGLLKEV